MNDKFIKPFEILRRIFVLYATNVKINIVCAFIWKAIKLLEKSVFD